MRARRVLRGVHRALGLYGVWVERRSVPPAHIRVSDKCRERCMAPDSQLWGARSRSRSMPRPLNPGNPDSPCSSPCFSHAWANPVQQHLQPNTGAPTALRTHSSRSRIHAGLPSRSASLKEGGRGSRASLKSSQCREAGTGGYHCRLRSEPLAL